MKNWCTKLTPNVKGHHACSFITGSMVLRKTDAFCVERDNSIDENKSSVPLPILKNRSDEYATAYKVNRLNS